MDSIDSAIADTSLSTTALIERLSRRAVEVIGRTMEDGSSESIRLKAAIDIADRGAETSKVQKHQLESFSITSGDARAIAEAMVAGASVRKRFAAEVQNDFDRVGMAEVAAGKSSEGGLIETPQSLLGILDAPPSHPQDSPAGATWDQGATCDQGADDGLRLNGR